MSSDIFPQLADRLKKIRIDANLKKGQFAKKIGISSAYITQLEKGKRSGLGEQLARVISITFNVNKDWLLAGEGSMYGNAANPEITQLSVSEPSSTYPQQTESIDMLVKKAIDILASKTVYSSALATNINIFHHGITCDKELALLRNMKSEMQEIKEWRKSVEERLTNGRSAKTGS